MLECSDDVVFMFATKSPDNAANNNNGKGWPDTEILPNGRYVCAEDLDIEAAWRLEYELSPSSTYVHQYVPVPSSANEGEVILSTKIKYFD